MDAAIHAVSGSKPEAAQAEPNAATAPAALAPAKRDRRHLRQDAEAITAPRGKLLRQKIYKNQNWSFGGNCRSSPRKLTRLGKAGCERGHSSGINLA